MEKITRVAQADVLMDALNLPEYVQGKTLDIAITLKVEQKKIAKKLDLDKYTSTTRLWNMDAQEFVNDLRSSDR